MRRISWTDLFFAAAITFCLFGACMSVITSMDFSRRCTAAGGDPITRKGVYLCLTKGATVPL